MGRWTPELSWPLLDPLTLDPVSGEATTLDGSQTKHIKLFFAMCILCILLGGPTTQSPSRPTCNLQHLSCDQPYQVPGNPPISGPVYPPNQRQLLLEFQAAVWGRVAAGLEDGEGASSQEPLVSKKGLPKAEINLSSPSSQRAWQTILSFLA